MKKLLCVLLAALMLCTMAACGNQQAPEQTDPITTTGNQSVEESTEASVATEESQMEALEEMRFPGADVYCKIPKESGTKYEGRVAIVTGYDEYIATVCCQKSSDFSGEEEDVISYLAETYVTFVRKFLSPNIEAGALKASATEKVSVSGYDAVKFSGPVANTDGGTYQIYGYSMIIDEMPVMFLGVLRSEDQAQADLAAMQALVDQMAGSIYK